jgi:chaperonin GroES|tara:strand:+ start:126 stop:2585 length:2460 start_codon:yes stop_codon:yes gene_type:complete
MAVDKRITGVKENVSVIEDDISLNIEDGDIINRPNADEEIDIEETEDGGALVDFDPSAPNLEAGFADNLAEVLNEKTLRTIASDLVGEFDSDHESRHEWEFAYTKGLDLLGFKYNERSEPFQGASGVTHPLLAESVTAFQAQAFKELLPPSGPVKTQVLGAETPEIIAQADRVQDFMNYQITDKMQEYTPDMDQLLFHLPLAGSAFKKVYYDATRQSAVSKFIPSEDLVVNYLATDLQSAERVTHIVKMSENDLLKQQVAGFYKDIDVQVSDEETAIQKKYNQLEGVNKVDYADDVYTLYEIHCDLDIEGFEDIDPQTGEPTGIKVPYVVTVDKGSNKVLSVYRNYKEGDPLRKKIEYFVHYKFLPGLGFYGFGLIHMLGGLSRTATSTLRQLIDAGTLSNLPAGFKAKGLRISGDDTPLQPGEFRDIDAPSGDIRAGLMPLPYKGPDQVLFQLLGFCVDAGQKFAAIADMKISETNTNAPVGTTLAMMEQGAKVMSAIHKRLHYSQKHEFKLLASVFGTFLPPEYPYMVVGGNQMVKQTDFDDRVDIIPVSDPNMFSMSQRVALAQQQLQLAQAAPEQHNLYEAYRRMYQSLGVQNIEAILPPPPQPQPIDPGIENAMALGLKPLRAFERQNHQAHIDAHRAFMSSSLVKSNLQVLALLQGHISEHVALMAREEIMQQMGPQMQQMQMQMQNPMIAQDPMVQQQMQQMQMQIESAIAVKIAEITNDMVAEEQDMLDKQGADQLVELREKELDIQASDVQRKVNEGKEKITLDKMKFDQKEDLQKQKIDSIEDIAELRARVALKKMNDQTKQKRMKYDN